MPHLGSDSLVQDGSVSEHPPSDGRMIDRQPTLPHHFFQIAIAERIPHCRNHALHRYVGCRRNHLITKGTKRPDECRGAALCCFGIALLAVFHIFCVLVEYDPD